MTLIPCRECNETVSGDAKTCPHCGVRLKPPAVRGFTVFLLIVFVGVLAFAGFNTNFAQNTMPRDVLAGTAMACFSDAMPGLFAGAMVGVDGAAMAERCMPNWFMAIRYGMPRIDAEGLAESLSQYP